MLIPFLVSIAAGGVVFVVGEYIRREVGATNEVSRKLVHSIHGLLVAVWPFIIGYQWTIAIEILFLLSVVSARHFHLFRWMWRVGRKSWGEWLYPVGIIVAALTAESVWIYLAAALALGLADAAAALVGKHYKRLPKYKIWGQAKSVAGSVAFFVVSCAILGSILAFSPLDLQGSAIVIVLGLSALLTAVENLGVYGTDNFLIPVVAVVALNLFH